MEKINKIKINNKMSIRDFKNSDAKSVCDVIQRCDEEIASKDYPGNIIKWWVSKLKPEYIIGKSKGRKCLVYLIGKKVVGYISLERNEIKKLHVIPENHKQGIGKKLIEEIEKYALIKGIPSLIVESSIFAEGFYKKNGFNKLEVKDCEYNGEKFKLIVMEKKIK